MYEIVKCDLCGSGNHEVLFQKKGFNIVRCKACGLAYVRKRLKRGVREEKYNEGIIAPVDHFRKTIKVNRRIFNELLDFVEEYVREGSLLDIGCSVGTLIEAAKERGMESYGC